MDARLGSGKSRLTIRAFCFCFECIVLPNHCCQTNCDIQLAMHCVYAFNKRVFLLERNKRTSDRNIAKILLGVAGCVGILALIRKFRRAEASEDVFRELLSGITSGPTPQAVLEQLAERAARLVHATGVYIERIDDDKKQLVSAALFGAHPPP